MPGLAAISSSASPEEVFSQLLPWIIGLLVLIALGTGLILLIRRHLQKPSASTAGTFTLHDLRSLHDSGQISDEEFERAKSLIIGQVSRVATGPKTDAADAMNGSPRDRSSAE